MIAHTELQDFICFAVVSLITVFLFIPLFGAWLNGGGLQARLYRNDMVSGIKAVCVISVVIWICFCFYYVYVRLFS